MNAAIVGTVAVAVVLGMTARRPIGTLVCLAVALRVLIPSTALAPDPGNLPVAHPAVVLVLLLTAAVLVGTGVTDAGGPAGRLGLLIVGGLAAGGALLALAAGSITGLWDHLFTVTGPALLFVVVVAGARWEPDIGARLRRTLLVLVAFEATLAVLQAFYRSSLVWTADYGATEWYRAYGTEGFRAMGTTDHPLVLGLLLALSVPLVARIRSGVVQVPLLVLVVGAVVTTQSRTALIAVGALVAIQALRGSSRRAMRVAAVAVTVGAVALVLGGFGLAVVSRFTEDSGSTDARRDAWALLPDIYLTYGVVGEGHGANYVYAQQAGLTQSLESPLLTFAVDWGALFTVAFLVAVITLVVLAWLYRADSSAAESAGVALVLVLSFNSLSAVSTTSVLLWAVVAIAWSGPVSGRHRVEAVQPDGVEAR